MKATDQIRLILDLVDALSEPSSTELPSAAITVQDMPLDDDNRRFSQIQDLVSSTLQSIYANEPHEKVANIDAVTTLAGGGINSPKHPEDIRIKDPSQ